MSDEVNHLVLRSILPWQRIKVYEPESNIIESFGRTYNWGYVTDKGNPKRFYVVYDRINFGSFFLAKSSLVPEDPTSGSTKAVNFGFPVKSAQGFDVRSPGIVLFQQKNYRGNAKDYRNSQQDITPSFPDGSDGVSSMVITGGKWTLYGNKNFKFPIITVGGESVLGEGLYHTFDGENKVKSIERVSN